MEPPWWDLCPYKKQEEMADKYVPPFSLPPCPLCEAMWGHHQEEGPHQEQNQTGTLIPDF